MSKKCPQCESKDIHITEYPNPTDSMATCYGCGYTGLVEQFPEQSVFDRITADEETLAEKLVYLECIDRMWHSTIFPYPENPYPTRNEAIAATVAKLKEVSE